MLIVEPQAVQVKSCLLLGVEDGVAGGSHALHPGTFVLATLWLFYSGFVKGRGRVLGVGG